MRTWILSCCLAGSLVLAGCGDSGGGAGSTTQPGVTDHLKQAGSELKQAATQVGAEMKEGAMRAETQVKPKLDEATEKAKEALHEAAQKVSDMTTTRPATQPNQ